MELKLGRGQNGNLRCLSMQRCCLPTRRGALRQCMARCNCGGQRDYPSGAGLDPDAHICFPTSGCLGMCLPKDRTGLCAKMINESEVSSRVAPALRPLEDPHYSPDRPSIV